MNESARAFLQREGVLELLELGPDDEVARVAEAPIPRDSMPEGGMRRFVEVASLVATVHLAPMAFEFAREASRLPTAPAASPTAERTDAPRTTAAPSDLPGGVGVVCSHQHPDAGGVVNIEALDAAARVLAGSVVEAERPNGPVLILDGRASSAAVQLFGRGLELVVHNDGSAVRVFEVLRHPAPTPSARGRESPAEPQAPVIDLRDWMQSATWQSWLRTAVEERAASPWGVHRLASAGMLLRLWSPADPAERAAVTAGGSDTPALRARRWAMRLSPEVTAPLEAAACREAEALLDAVLSIDEASPLTVHAVLVARDDLESARRVLSAAGEGRALAAALRRVDRAAELRLPSFALGDEARGDARLRAAATADPDAWWALLALE